MIDPEEYRKKDGEIDLERIDAAAVEKIEETPPPEKLIKALQE